LTDSYIDALARGVGSAVELAAVCKVEKYSASERTLGFQPITV